MRVHFIHNLRSDTYAEVFRAALHPFGYLLAPNNATRTLRAFAEDLRKSPGTFLADNGNFQHIGKVKAQFATRAQVLWKQVQALEKNGRSLRQATMPAELRREYLKLADDAANEVLLRAGTGEMRLAEQVALNPTRLIGVENITISVWLSLNIEPAYVAYPRHEYRRRNDAVARAAAKRVKALPKPLAQAYYPVASAPSYDAAFDAGAAFARQGIDRVSMGFGAFMADNNAIDHLDFDGTVASFPDRYPQRYLRTAAVARGFWDGYRSVRRRSPLAFHFLGLGAPIMMPIVALCAWGSRELTFDAMSPVKDAVEGSLYTVEPAYLKLRVRKVALNLASQPGKWDCPCPFCRAFLTARPMRYGIARAWYRRTNPREVTAADLRPGGVLYDAFPLFAEPSEPALRKLVSAARIGHNHWALEQVFTRMRNAAGSRAALTSHAQRVVDNYVMKTTPQYAGAMRIAMTLATRGPKGLL